MMRAEGLLCGAASGLCRGTPPVKQWSELGQAESLLGQMGQLVPPVVEEDEPSSGSEQGAQDDQVCSADVSDSEGQFDAQAETCANSMPSCFTHAGRPALARILSPPAARPKTMLSNRFDALDLAEEGLSEEGDSDEEVEDAAANSASQEPISQLQDTKAASSSTRRQDNMSKEKRSARQTFKDSTEDARHRNTNSAGPRKRKNSPSNQTSPREISGHHSCLGDNTAAGQRGAKSKQSPRPRSRKRREAKQTTELQCTSVVANMPSLENATADFEDSCIEKEDIHKADNPEAQFPEATGDVEMEDCSNPQKPPHAQLPKPTGDVEIDTSSNPQMPPQQEPSRGRARRKAKKGTAKANAVGCPDHASACTADPAEKLLLKGEPEMASQEDVQTSRSNESENRRPALTGERAQVLAMMTSRMHEAPVLRYMRRLEIRKLVLAVPIDAASPQTSDMLDIMLGIVIHCEAVDVKTNWALGTIVAPRELADQRGCFVLQDILPMLVEARSNRFGDELVFSHGSWEQVVQLQGSTTQARLRQKALTNRLKTAYTNFSIKKP